MQSAPRLLALIAAGVLGCDRQILVGQEPTDASARSDAIAADAGEEATPLDAADEASTTTDSGLVPLAVPWSTGFEPGDSWLPGDTCYVTGGATFTIVTSPVHSGQHAAAFSIDTAVASPSHTRCLKQGALPPTATYGAWYYVPTAATNPVNWNLLHFQGADVANGALAHGLWDVSLTSGPDGGLRPFVFDFLRMRTLTTTAPIPLDTWVHLEVTLRRASDGTGQFTLRRDGQVILDLPGISTDDSQWGQWFVGNFAVALTPPTSTVYVDDVSILGP